VLQWSSLLKVHFKPFFSGAPAGVKNPGEFLSRRQILSGFDKLHPVDAL
jgi:hypothetical protein